MKYIGLGQDLSTCLLHINYKQIIICFTVKNCLKDSLHIKSLLNQNFNYFIHQNSLRTKLIFVLTIRTYHKIKFNLIKTNW